MKKIQWVIWAVVVLVVDGSVAHARQGDFISTSLQADIVEIMHEKNIPALGVGIIEDGELRQVEVYGELKSNTPAPSNAVFNVASLTKPITTLLTLSFVSSGDWDLDEPLSRYWVDPDVADDPTHKRLTTRHVLTHQTGFDNWRRNNEQKKLRFNFEPGTECKYSGEGFEYLRRAMEHKFNKTFEELVDAVILKPYGMDDTSLLWDSDVHEKVYAEEHNKDGMPYNLRKRTRSPSASDDLLTTIEDYGAFCVNVLKGTGLTQEIYDDMIRPQAVVRENVAYGLGWYMKLDFYKGEYALTHTGGDAGVATKVILMPDSNRGVIMFTNGDNGFDVMAVVEAALFPTEN